jgi:hypothetical protein
LDTLKTPYGPEINGFLVKLSSNGSILWAKQPKLTKFPHNSYVCENKAISIDETGNIYVAGNFNDTVIFGSTSLYTTGGSAIFFVKYDSTGNVIWAKESNSNNVSDDFNSSTLSVDALNHFYLGIYGGGNLIFGNDTMLTPSDFLSSFILELDTSGNALCGTVIKNGGESQIISNTVDSAGKYIYLSATIDHDTVFCGPDTFLPYGNAEIPYLARWKPCEKSMEGIKQLTMDNVGLKVYPNPTSASFTVMLPQAAPATLEMYNELGEEIISNYQLVISNPTTINVSCLLEGVYFYRVVNISGGLIGEGKLIIER